MLLETYLSHVTNFNSCRKPRLLGESPTLHIYIEEKMLGTDVASLSRKYPYEKHNVHCQQHAKCNGVRQISYVFIHIFLSTGMLYNCYQDEDETFFYGKYDELIAHSHSFEDCQFDISWF